VDGKCRHHIELCGNQGEELKALTTKDTKVHEGKLFCAARAWAVVAWWIWPGRVPPLSNPNHYLLTF